MNVFFNKASSINKVFYSTKLSERLASLDMMGASIRTTPETPQSITEHYRIEGSPIMSRDASLSDSFMEKKNFIYW